MGATSVQRGVHFDFNGDATSALGGATIAD